MKHITIIPFAFLLTSCTSYYYMPTAQNVPLFTEDKQLQTSIGIDQYVTNYQAAFSVTNHIAVQYDGLDRKDNVYGGSSGKRVDYFLNEGSVGYFTSFKNTAFGNSLGSNFHYVFETYAGYGSGIANKYSKYGTSADIHRLDVLPAFGITSNWFDVALSARCSQVNLPGYQSTVFYSNQYATNITATTFGAIRTNYYFVEPCLTLRAGCKYVKVQCQYLKALKFSPEYLNYIQGNLAFSILANIPINKIFPSKSKQSISHN